MENLRTEMFIVPNDYQKEIYNLQKAIRGANDSYKRLCDNPDLLGLPSHFDLSYTWLNDYVSQRIEAVRANRLFDSQTTERLVKLWEEIQKKCSCDVRIVQKFVKEFKDQIQTDENGQLEFIDLNVLAAQRAQKPLPPECNDHIIMLECIRDMVLKLRQWEKAHRCLKRPLEWLLKADKDTLKTEWAQGTILINDEEEAQDYNRTAKWMRQAAEQLIF